jgi:alpha-glucosidase
MIIDGRARFTVLTPRLVRLEWSDTGAFEDSASLLVINRRLPVPKFSSATKDGWLTIATDSLTLRYKSASGKFTGDNLRIEYPVGGTTRAWRPGMKDTANLKGTTRTLDGVEGATPLEPGLLSRDGWTLVDDSRRPLFDGGDWPWVEARPDSNSQDWYFFGYGRDYTALLADFTKIAGKIPMPPRFAFGLWWSRYWSYTDREFKDLVGEFRQHDVPLDVLVIDMDWHKTFNLRWGRQPKDQAGQPLGWTGYTWDENVFPDPEGFLAWCEEQGLKTPLNLHPASGIQPHEEHYPEMARSMGINPATKKYVPFDIVDKRFATNYLTHMIRPLEAQGVDFWWLDWQQWGTTAIPGVTPTWWLNYVFFTDMERQGKARPLLFHRWGGLGNHRYQIGFSGDAESVWKSLAFQPYFTSTAANVGFGYWSHDIGGHLPGTITPELYTRWVQFGILSPILRTHTTKNPDAERRIWAYPEENYRAMRDAILLRYALIPYIYTAARQAYDSGVSICRPMYYDHPEDAEAYAYFDQYMFGNDMLSAPVTDSLRRDSLLAAKKIWLPEGRWYEWATGTMLEGPAVVERTFALDEIPLYIRAGAVIPMQPKMKNSHEKPVDPLLLTIVPGAAGSTRLYEDEGNSLGYQRDECAWTPVEQNGWAGDSLKIAIGPASGSYAGMPAERSYEIRLPGTLPPASVRCEGRALAYAPREGDTGWRYDGEKQTTVITLPRFPRSQAVRVAVKPSVLPDEQAQITGGVAGLLSRLHRVTALVNNQWPKEWSPDSLVAAAQTGNRATVRPAAAAEEFSALKKNLPSILKGLGAIDIGASLAKQIVSHCSPLLASPRKPKAVIPPSLRRKGL